MDGREVVVFYFAEFKEAERGEGQSKVLVIETKARGRGWGTGLTTMATDDGLFADLGSVVDEIIDDDIARAGLDEDRHDGGLLTRCGNASPPCAFNLSCPLHDDGADRQMVCVLCKPCSSKAVMLQY